MNKFLLGICLASCFTVLYVTASVGPLTREEMRELWKSHDDMRNYTQDAMMRSHNGLMIQGVFPKIRAALPATKKAC